MMLMLDIKAENDRSHLCYSNYLSSAMHID